jgi:hypothetical protein
MAKIFWRLGLRIPVRKGETKGTGFSNPLIIVNSASTRFISQRIDIVILIMHSFEEKCK